MTSTNKHILLRRRLSLYTLVVGVGATTSAVYFLKGHKAASSDALLPVNAANAEGTQHFTAHASNHKDKKIVPSSNIPTSVKQRLYEARITGPANLQAIGRPGYYTFILFSASWCVPCKLLWKATPQLIEPYPNVTAVEINTDALFDEKNTVNEKGEFLKHLDLHVLPAAYLLGPFGEIKAYASGYDNIKAKILDRLSDPTFRSYQQPILVENVKLVPLEISTKTDHVFETEHN